MTNANGTLDLAFEENNEFAPLAAQLRPKTLDEYQGQAHILSPGMPLYQAIEQGNCHSVIFWGPPGTGKTTLAEIIASHANAEVERISAVTSGIKEIRQAIDNAKQRLTHQQKRTLLFVDEVHRFNKSQQDAFLPYIEDGTIIFIGATTENPAFELNRAVLSRARVYTLKKLTESDLATILKRALATEQENNQKSIVLEEKAKLQLIAIANGDARRLLNILEHCIEITSSNGDSSNNYLIDVETVIQVSGDKTAMYDKNGDAFYDLISAFHKSVRGSEPDAALYWYARILAGGGDALYVARRLLAIASEDIGNADPRAMQLAINAWDTFQRVGPSEGERAIAQAIVYMALAPKSNAVYMAFNQAKALAKDTSHLEVPFHLRNSTSKITEELGHGEDYRYAHNEDYAFAAGECYLPEQIKDTSFYQPTDRGLEKQLKDKQAFLQSLNQQSSNKRYD